MTVSKIIVKKFNAVIPVKYKKQVIEAIKKVNLKNFVTDYEKFMKLDDLVCILAECGWMVILNDNKYVFEWFGFEWGSKQEKILNSIAAYIEPEFPEDGPAYFEFVNEDDERARWVIKDGECREIFPEITWKWENKVD